MPATGTEALSRWVKDSPTLHVYFGTSCIAITDGVRSVVETGGGDMNALADRVMNTWRSLQHDRQR